MSETATLGELITWLERCPPDAQVLYSDGHAIGSLMSSRGNYAELALGTEEYSTMPAKNCVEFLRSAIGRDFDGYKGGRWRMCGDTPIWRDNWGEWTGTAIIGGRMLNGAAVILVCNPQSRIWEV